MRHSRQQLIASALQGVRLWRASSPLSLSDRAPVRLDATGQGDVTMIEVSTSMASDPSSALANARLDGVGRRDASTAMASASSAAGPSSASDSAGVREPIQRGLQALVVGDSGLSLNKSRRGSTPFEWELSQELGQGIQAHIKRFPNEGATAIINHLRCQRNVDVVVVVWFLNELFTGNRQLVHEYPDFMDRLAIELAEALVLVPCAMAVIGGTAELWRVPERYNDYVRRICQLFSDRGILVVDGTDLYPFLSRWPDGWHARSTDKNKQLMAEYYANLIRTMILEL